MTTTVQAPGAVASVHSWDLSTGVDGPGTRLVVFLSGCPLRCLYCHNPDTWCRCTGTPTPVSDLEALIDRYAPFTGRAGGGLTISGGEPLMQPEVVRALFAHARERGVHTALDTSGFLGVKADDALLDLANLVLLDVKAGTEETCVRLTRRPLAPTIRFAERLADLGVPVWIRHVLVPGITDVPEELDRVAAIAAGLGNVERVDILPFHTLGHEKYDRLGIPFPLEGVRPPSAEAVDAARARFTARGVVAF